MGWKRIIALSVISFLSAGLLSGGCGGGGVSSTGSSGNVQDSVNNPPSNNDSNSSGPTFIKITVDVFAKYTQQTGQQPIPGATVKIYRKGVNATGEYTLRNSGSTNNVGRYSWTETEGTSLTSNYSYTVVVEATGYASYSSTAQVGTKDIVFTVYLVPGANQPNW